MVTSKRIATVALTFWVAALFSPALKAVGSDEAILGALHLAIGWTALLFLNFAWLSNPFFLIGIYRIFRSKPSFWPCFLSMVFAFDTFRLSEFPRVIIDSANYIYGYGIGVAFWIFSTCTLVAASSQWYREQRIVHNSQESGEEFISSSGVMVAIGFAVFLSYHTYSDRKTAGSEERIKLENVMFMRGEVCSIDQPIAHKSSSASGQLIELIVDKESQSLGSIGQVKTLLNLGVSAVRFQERDFSYRRTDTEELLISVPSKDIKPTATVQISSNKVNSITAIQLRVANSENKTLFDYTWHLDSRGIACPDFSVYAAKDKEPMKSLALVLGL